jgi:hypothetical protein
MRNGGISQPKLDQLLSRHTIELPASKLGNASVPHGPI